MRKLYLFILVLTITLLSSSCGSSNNNKTPVTETKNNETTKTETTTATTKSNNGNITLPEQVVYDGNDIKVTVIEFNNESLFGPEVKVLIENNSTKNITVQTRNSSVNGLMVDTIFSADVAAGKKANDNITLISSDLEIAGITTIKDIEFSLHVIDSDTWDTIMDTDTITLTTSADPSFVQKYDDTGFVAYDADNIKVVVKKIDSSESLWGSDVYLYIENNSSQDITVQARDVSLNGFMIDPVFSSDITAGKKAFDTMTFMESDLSENGITNISNLEFKLHIFDAKTWNTIKDTDTIKVSFE